MGDVIDPKPPQWQRKEEQEDVRDDRVIALAQRYISLWQEEVDPTVVHLAALRLVYQGILSNYKRQQGDDATAELVRQAEQLATQYDVK